MNVNPMQLLQMIKGGQNPQQLVMSILQQQGNNNPIIQNAADLAQKGDTAALRSIAQNLAAQRGLDFDKEFANFTNYIK
jgi:hypothetical protein